LNGLKTNISLTIIERNKLKPITSYPFSSAFESRLYSYGFQGSEKDDEVKGQGNSYTTQFRQLDPRIGRWLSIDPKSKEMQWQSPYCSMDNNPIWHNAILGDKIRNKHEGAKDNQSKINEKSNALNEMESKEDYKNKDGKQLRKEINSLQNQLDIYNKIERLIYEFKNAVGEEEFNRLDKLEVDKVEIDIIIGFANKRYIPGSEPPQLVKENAQTEIPLLMNRNTFAGFNKDSPILITLYKDDLGTLANEFGEALFGAYNPKKVFDQRNLPYRTAAKDLFSFDYEYWVRGFNNKERQKPDISTY